MFIAHRGCVTKEVKENSLLAFNKAIEDPRYGGFELDVRETIDHEFVVTHDFLIHNNLIKKTKLIDLEALGLSSLDSVLKLKASKRVFVDIKDFNINISKLANTLNKAKLDIYVMSFNANVIRKIKPYAKQFKCGIINYFYNRQNNYNDFNFVVLLNDSITFNVKEYFRKRNIIVVSYGIGKKIIYDNNIDYIIDNYKDYVIE
jgi:glycerophosphoryl diester phosphodiesterase